MLLLSPASFADYELIDVGNFEKLERFGTIVTIRPEPQAVWKPLLPEREWENRAHVRFVQNGPSTGIWRKIKPETPDKWTIDYKGDFGKPLRFRMSLTNFKHVGIFPEQATNWEYIQQSLLQTKQILAQKNITEEPRFLNLFAYTGGASLAAKASGADVSHVDSIRQVVGWARENMELSGLDNIRWIVEDALTYVKREVKRGKTYHGIILDPPAFGHGPNKERWQLEEHIGEMMDLVLKLLDPVCHFLILNTYSLGFSSLIVENLLAHRTKMGDTLETGELFLPSTTGLKLPLGVFGRVRNY